MQHNQKTMKEMSRNAKCEMRNAKRLSAVLSDSGRFGHLDLLVPVHGMRAQNPRSVGGGKRAGKRFCMRAYLMTMLTIPVVGTMSK